MEYKNISTAAVAEDLFEVPQDYTKFAMPDMGGMGEMMKGMMPGGK